MTNLTNILHLSLPERETNNTTLLSVRKREGGSEGERIEEKGGKKGDRRDTDEMSRQASEEEWMRKNRLRRMRMERESKEKKSHLFLNYSFFSPLPPIHT